MEKTLVIHARIDPALKQASEAVLHGLGLTTADAIRLFLKQVELRQEWPLELKLPNAASRKALKEARAGKVRRYKNFGELRSKLKV